MLDIQFSRDAQKFLQKLSQKKHLRQIKDALGRLRENPYPHDSQSLHGDLKNRSRIDVGEYRIIYHIEDNTLKISLVGKRNDSDVYRRAKRKK